MAAASAVLNRSLRKILSPALRETGFQHVDARKAWFWREECIWVFIEDGLAWYSEVSDLRRAFSIIERMNDCLEKFTKAALLARRIGDDESRKKYDALAEAEARRIGVKLDRGT